MAQGRDQIIVDVHGNTKPLEKNIAKAANQALTLNTKGFSQPLGKISGQLGEFEKSLAASNARVIAFGASAGAIYAVQQAFNATIKSVIDVEKSLTDINVILNVSQKSLATFGNRLFDIAKNTGLSFSEVAKAATEFSRQGLGIEDTLRRTSDALILTRLSGLDTVSSVEALTAAINSFSSSALTSTQIVNKLAAVDAAFAVSSADLAEAIKRVGSSANDVGVSFDQLISLVTSAQQITARGGSVIGNSFKTIFTRLQRPKTLEALEEIGVATKDQEGNILPLIQILNSLSQSYEKLGSVQKAQLAETIGGVFQINVLKASLGDLSKEYSIFTRALEISSTASDEANRRNEALNETLSATLNKTVVNLQSAATDIGNLAIAPALQKALGGLNYVLENFGAGESEGVGAKIGEGLARGLGNFLSGPGLLLGAASLIKIFERLTVFTADAFKQLTGLNTQSVEQRTLQTQILNLIGRNPQIIEQINSGNLNTTNLHKQILSLIEQETAAMQKQVAVANSLTNSLMTAGVRVAQTGAMRGTAIKPKSFGFIPNFKASEEIMGALAGGYAPGQIKSTFIPNYGKVTYNSAETVKKFNGMSQPAIMPPSDSAAGKNYKKNFKAAHGFNPYANRGFIPNFASIKESEIYPVGERIGMLSLYGKSGNSLKSTTSLQQLGFFNDLIKRNPSLADNKITFQGIQVRSFEDLKKEPQQFTKDVNDAILPGLAMLAQKYIGTVLGDDGSQAVNEVSKNLKGAAILPPGAEGDIFESVVKFATKNTSGFIKSVSDDFRRPFDFEEAGVASQVFKSAFGFGDSLQKADAKRTATDEQIRSLIKKAYNSGAFPDLPYYNLGLGAQKTSAKELPASYRKSGRRQAVSGGKYGGFIPNFSPIDRAFAAEKSLGGDPILDYQSGLGLYVRDRKTQPNFSAVKRDHPEGIDSAIGNAYAIQKSMAAFGFVPNFIAAKARKPQARDARGRFAQTTPDTALQNAVTEAATETSNLAEETKKTKFDFEKYRSNLIFASFGLSLVGSYASELAGDNQILSKNINSFSQGLSTALTAVQLIPGPAGLVVGGLGALYVGANFLAKTFRDNGEQINANLEKIKEETTIFANATSTYSQALQKLTDAYRDAKTPAETIVKLNQNLAEAAINLPEKYRLQLLAITDNTKLQEEINIASAKLAKEQRNLEFATRINTKLAEGGLLGAPQVFTTAQSAKGAANEIFGGFSNEGQIKFLKNLNQELFKLPQPELISFLEKFYGLNSDIADVLSRLSEGEFKNLSTGLLLFAQGVKNAQEEFNATDALRKEEVRTQTQLKKETDKAKIALDGLNEALNDIINTSIKSQTFRQNFGQIQSANARGIQLSRATDLLSFQELFRSEESTNITKSKIGNLARNEEFSAQARQISSSARQSILEIGTSLLQNLRTSNQEEPQSKAAIEAFESQLLSISQNTLSSAQTAELLSEAVVSTFGSGFNKNLEIQSKIKDISREQNEKLTLLGEEQKKANEIAKSNLQIQQKIVQARRDIATFGGAQAFIDPESFKSTVENFSKSLNQYRSGRGTVARGRGAAGLISETLGLVGGGFSQQLSKGFGSLRSTAISGRAQDLRNQARELSKGAPSGVRAVLSDVSKRSREIATTQIDNLLKDEKIGQNVDEIAKILKQIEGAQTLNVMPELNNSILAAINAVQVDLTPSIDGLKLSLDRASEVFSARETYQGIGEELGVAKLRKATGEIQAGVAEKEIANLTPQLETLLGNILPQRGGPYSEYSVSRQRRFSEFQGALNERRPISLKDLGLQSQANTPFGQLLEQYNKQINILETSKGAIEGSSQALEQLNSRAVDAAAALSSLGQNVTPVGNLAAPQAIQGSIDLNVPNNLLELNVGGRVSFDGGNFQVTISPESDLTTLVTPIVANFMSQVKADLENNFNSQIGKLREDAGLRRQPIPLGR